MHRLHFITGAAALASAVAVAGCGDGSTSSGATVATTPAVQRSVERAGTITVRGDYAPGEHGPYTLHGTYRVRFAQRGAGVDFTREVPFTAHLETTATPPRTIPLFKTAATTGTTRVQADGRFMVIVDFGDSPYEVVLTPVGRR
jgi:hypothetical protein